MTWMFAYASAFNGDLSNFDTSRVTSMWSMFSSAKAIDDNDLGPEPPAEMLEESLYATDTITNKITATSPAAISGSTDVNVNSSNQLAAEYLTEALQSGRINPKEVLDILNSFQHTPTTTTTSTEYINQLSYAADKTNKVNMTASSASSNNNDEHCPPTPFNSAEFEDDKVTIAKKKAKDEMYQKPVDVSNNELVLSNRDSIYEPQWRLLKEEKTSAVCQL